MGNWGGLLYALADRISGICPLRGQPDYPQGRAQIFEDVEKQMMDQNVMDRELAEARQRRREKIATTKDREWLVTEREKYGFIQKRMKAARKALGEAFPEFKPDAKDWLQEDIDLIDKRLAELDKG